MQCRRQPQPPSWRLYKSIHEVRRLRSQTGASAGNNLLHVSALSVSILSKAEPGWPHCALKWIFKLPLPELQVDAAVARVWCISHGSWIEPRRRSRASDRTSTGQNRQQPRRKWASLARVMASSRLDMTMTYDSVQSLLGKTVSRQGRSRFVQRDPRAGRVRMVKLCVKMDF